ncbi:MAG: polyribonucleotide nucleotidyltransferase [bacterium]
MSNDIKTFSRNIAGKEITVEINRFKSQADGNAAVRIGDTIVMANASMGREADTEKDFFPLNVDYEENLYACGKIKGSRFVKRKGRPTDEAILTSRLIDRGIRPLFPKGMKNPVQVIVSTLSFDKEHDADIISVMAASIALAVSGIPFDGPASAVRIGLINNELTINPSISERKFSTLDLLVSTAQGKAIMIEAGAQEIPEDIMNSAISLAIKTGEEINGFIKEIASEFKKTTQIQPLKIVSIPDYSEELAQDIVKEAREEITQILASDSDKKDIELGLNKILESRLALVSASLSEEDQKSQKSEIKKAFDGAIKKIVRKNILEKNSRPGNRKLDEIRELKSEAGLLPRTHGSGYFQRGETRALTITTLGSPSEAIIVDGMEEEITKRYIHYYSFPPYSTGEISPLRSPGRREIGHGALAEKALEPVIPSKEEFPYTILLQTEIISCNGSSSMASICGSTLSLMDAGVPIKNPVAGIAMGLMTNPNDINEFKVLTDIKGIEDFSGDMDFKIAGTQKGITAIQMDTKLQGLPSGCISETLSKAREARIKIIEVIQSAIREPRPELSPYAPKIITIKINKDKIGELIGPGGKTINSIIDKTGAKIDIEEDGSVFISSSNSEGVNEALKLVESYTREVKTGEIFEGKVARILDFGAFVEITPKQSGLVHISEISSERVNRVEDVLQIGDVVTVKVKNIDDMGRINLTMKNLK